MSDFTLTTTDSRKKIYTRWTFNERVQHWMLAISFIVLVITGFALKYPESWWVSPFTGFTWFQNFRGLIHRIAGAVFLALGVYHTYYAIATRRGRLMIKSFLPNGKDFKDFGENIAYNLGIRKTPPQFSHFSYIEKAEYLALIWGAVIMGVTGLMLWFEELTLHLFPRWVIDLLTVIHLYEAWLATLAIIVWHFYYVIFNPDIYPLNTSMVSGNLTDEEMRHEYFLEWKELQEQGKEEAEPEAKEDA